MADIPVVFCFDDRILLGAGVSILSLLESARDTTTYALHILHPGLSDPVIAGLSSLVTGSRHSITFHHVSPSRFADAPSGRGSWTEIVYFRLLIPEILGSVDRAIYSDVDVFFRRDLSDAFATDLDGIEWAGVAAEANRPDYVLHKHFPENSKELTYFSGFMVMNLRLMREAGALQRYYATIRSHGSELRFFDLDLLNIATPKIARLPFDYVVLEDIFETEDIGATPDFRFLRTAYSEQELLAARVDPAIIHYAGPRGKPWQRCDMPDYFLRVARQLPAILRKPTFRDVRKRLLSRRGRARLATRTGKTRSPFFGLF